MAAGPLAFDVHVSVDVEGVIAAARDASAVILRFYNDEAGAWEVEQKADSSPLTRADREANTLICGALAFRAFSARRSVRVRELGCAGTPRVHAATRPRRNPDTTAGVRSQRAWLRWRRTCRS